MTTTSEINRTRNARNRARRLDLVLTRRGDSIKLSDRERRPVFTGTLEEVEQWLAPHAMPSGPDPTPTPTAWLSWIDLFVAEQQAAHRSSTTIETRIGHLATFARAHADATPLTVRREDLVAWVGRPDLTPRSAHSIRSTMRVFFRLLCDLGHRRDNPAATLPAIALPRSRPRPCPDHAVKDALAEARGDARVLLALRIATETGLRRIEIARVNGGDVEGREGDYRLHVVGKGGHERAVPISDGLAAEILAHSGYLFAGRDGQPITPRYLGKLISAALPDHWTAHTIRHRFATVAYQATSDLRAVQELLGHSSPVTTAVYTKVADDSMRRAAAAAALED